MEALAEEINKESLIDQPCPGSSKQVFLYGRFLCFGITVGQAVGIAGQHEIVFIKCTRIVPLIFRQSCQKETAFLLEGSFFRGNQRRRDADNDFVSLFILQHYIAREGG